MSYSVTLSLKVGGGQDEIILLGAAKIVTRWVRWGGLRYLCHHFLGYFWQYFDGQNGIKSGCLNKRPVNVTEKSLKCDKKLFEKPSKRIKLSLFQQGGRGFAENQLVTN